jgi:hypothetical protein
MFKATSSQPGFSDLSEAADVEMLVQEDVRSAGSSKHEALAW